MSPTRRAGVLLLAAALGAGLGLGARALMSTLGPTPPPGWGAVVRLVSDTWGWALIAVLVTLALTTRATGRAWQRWLWAWAIAAAFLAATTTAWYGSGEAGLTPTAAVLGMAVCVPIAAGIAFVAAFLDDVGLLGLLAALALPAGLALVLIANPPQPWSTRDAVTTWWQLQAIGAALGAAAVARHLWRRRHPPGQAEPGPAHRR